VSVYWPLSYRFVKDGQTPDTSHVSKEQASEIRNTALPKFAKKKERERNYILPSVVCLVFPRVAGREQLN
jgi:hypothetical protein